MTPKFEYRAHYNEAGKPCHCPWGKSPDGEHLGSVREASKLDWLEDPKKRPEFHDPNHKEFKRNRYWLDYVKKHGLANEKTDKLLPWLHREFKKGSLLPAVLDPKSPYAERGADTDRGILQFREDGSKWPPADSTWPARALPLEGDESGRPTKAVDHYSNGYLERPTLEAIQDNLEEMKKRGQGIDVMSHGVPDLLAKVNDFSKWKAAEDEAKKREGMGEVLHRFDDGWTMRRLQNAEEHKDEGDKMGHCIGGQGYCEDTAHGRNIYASLRDEKNLPHASLQISPDHWRHKDTGEIYRGGLPPGDPDWVPQVGSRSEPGEFYGKQDSSPEPEYENRVNEWLNHHGAPYAEGGGNEAQWVDLPAAETVADYNTLHGEGGDYHELAEQYADAPIGEHTEFGWSEPDLHSVADDYLTYGVPISDTHVPYGIPGQYNPRVIQPHLWDYDTQQKMGIPGSLEPRDQDELFSTLHDRDEGDWFDESLHQLADPENVRHQKLIGQWNNWREDNTNRYPKPEYTLPMVQETEHPEPRLSPGAPRYQLDENGNYLRSPGLNPIPAVAEGPWQKQWNYPTYSSATRPLYYRWVYSPSKGVTLGTNQDDHPALVKYHRALGGDINDTDLVHGYASALDGGWRITNLEHGALEDPYIVQQVVRRLNHEDGPEKRLESAWQPSEYNWDRIHYGLPQGV